MTPPPPIFPAKAGIQVFFEMAFCILASQSRAADQEVAAGVEDRADRTPFVDTQ
jgi:hypothetical protein